MKEDIVKCPRKLHFRTTKNAETALQEAFGTKSHPRVPAWMKPVRSLVPVVDVPLGPLLRRALAGGGLELARPVALKQR